MPDSTNALAERFYLPAAAAFLRTQLEASPDVAVPELFATAARLKISLKRFKRSLPLPRVQRVLGFLQAVQPTSLLDVGTGRGAFLWPLLDAFPDLPVHCVDLLEHRVAMLRAVQAGGVDQLSAEVADIRNAQPTAKPSSNAFDVVTALEVLEHIPSPQSAIEQLVQAATRFIVVSVPSKEDENPEHVNLFTQADLEERFLDAGASRVSHDHVLNHRLAFVTP